jgi:hypothetical protein
MFPIIKLSGAFGYFVFLTVMIFVITASISASKLGDSSLNYTKLSFNKSAGLQNIPFNKQTYLPNQSDSKLSLLFESSLKQIDSLINPATRKGNLKSSLFTDDKLTVSSVANPTACPAIPPTINFGQPTNGATLSTDDCIVNGYYVDDYLFSGNAGQQAFISMNSTDFDTLVGLYGTNGQLLEFNDDIDLGIIQNSLISLLLPTNGVYRIRATSFNPNTTGRYTLALNNNLSTGNLFSVSGAITTSKGAPLNDVPITTVDGLKITRTIFSGAYNIVLQQDRNQTIAPKLLSTHSFSPPSYDFSPSTINQTGKNFTATLRNDNFVNAVQLIGSSGEIDGNNQNATRETDEPLHAGVVGGSSVWYRWRAPRNGQFTFSLGGSKFDTLLAIYQGTSVGSLSPVIANDNWQAATFSRVVFTADANTDYWIAVDGRAGKSASGFFKMTYHPADYVRGFTVSGTVKTNNPIFYKIPGTPIKAETTTGQIITTTISGINETYSIDIPVGVNSFKLTAFTDRGTVSEILNTNTPTYNFVISGYRDTEVAVIPRGSLAAIDNIDASNLTVSISGANIVGSAPCPVSRSGTGVNFTCPDVFNNGTYKIIPTHPSISFLPTSKTIVATNGTIENVSFVKSSPVGGITFTGNIAQGNTLLSGVIVTAELYSELSVFPDVTIDAETNADGSYSIGPLPVGKSYKLSAYLPGFNFNPSVEPTFSNLPSGSKRVDFSATPTISGCSYVLSGVQPQVLAYSGIYSFNITTNNGCPWEAKTKSTGFTIASPLSYGTGTISYFVEANSGAARTGTITVAGQTFTVNQSGSKSRKRIRIIL